MRRCIPCWATCAVDTRDLAAVLLRQAQLVGRRAQFAVQLKSSGEAQPLSDHHAQQIRYLLHEALANIERHAHAHHVSITLSWTQAALTLAVADDGGGFDPASVERDAHFGLRFMRERIEELNGQLTLASHPQHGTRVTFHIPLADGLAHRAQRQSQCGG